MKNNKTKIRVLGVISIILLCIGLTRRELQNDTFYIIKLGEYISKHGVDLLDHWSWISNLTYTYPHWLYDLFVFIVYNSFDYVGIYISTIILFIILVLSIYIVHLKTHKNEFLALLVAILSTTTLSRFVTARAQLPTTILFFLEVYFIEKLIESGNKKYIIILTGISLLIANVHATIWIFYFILYLPFIGEHLIYLIKNSKIFMKKSKRRNPEESKLIIQKITHIKELLTSFILGLFMGVFTPSRICYTYVLKTMQGNSLNYISEHAPLVLIKYPYILFLILLILLILIFTNTKIKLREFFMLGGLILMSLVSIRHVVFLCTIGVYYIAILCTRCLYNKNDKTLDVLSRIITNNKIVYIALLTCICFFAYNKFNENKKLDYINKELYPVEASNYIKNNLDLNKTKLYNDYNFGSYLLFQDIPVFVDSRCDLYLKEFNDMERSIIDDAHYMSSLYEENFAYYDISHALVYKNDSLYIVLNKDQNYNLLYDDDFFALFKRKNENEI